MMQFLTKFRNGIRRCIQNGVWKEKDSSDGHCKWRLNCNHRNGIDLNFETKEFLECTQILFGEVNIPLGAEISFNKQNVSGHIAISGPMRLKVQNIEVMPK